MRKLYPSHVPTSGPQKVLLAASSALLALSDPTRTTQVARLGDVTSGPVLGRLRDRMRATEEGAQLLRDRPSLKDARILDALAASAPEHSLGRAYVDFMRGCDLDPLSRADVRYGTVFKGGSSNTRAMTHVGVPVDDAELAFVMQRYREVHDVWHPLLGIGRVSVADEVALKWVEALQTRLPMTALAAMVGPLRLSWEERHHLATHVLPWALRHARSATFLLGIYYERHWMRPLEDVRREWGVTALHD